MRRLWAALLIVLATVHTSILGEAAEDPSAEEATITLDGAKATYAGKITDPNVECFMDTVKGKKVSMLVISSSGGEINAGMRMGEWVFDNQVDVVVERMCMSSCANYVFPAGRNKTIRTNSIVAWHGSILQEGGMSDADVREKAIKAYAQLPENIRTNIALDVMIDQAIQQMREYRESSIVNQEQFFRKIGVDEYICRVGNEKYGAKDFFILCVEDMARFGIRDVLGPKNYEDIDLTPFRRTGKSVEFIHLD